MNAQIGANAPPSRMPWPPILMAMTLAAGLALDAATGASLIDRASSSITQIAGAAIVFLALANDVWCFHSLASSNNDTAASRRVLSRDRGAVRLFAQSDLYVSCRLDLWTWSLPRLALHAVIDAGSRDRADEAGDRARRAASSWEIWRRLSVLYGAHAAVALN